MAKLRQIVATLLGAMLVSLSPAYAVPFIFGGGGHIIQDEGNSLAQRSQLNFTGNGVVCADSGGKTVCTISGTGGTGYATVQEEGTSLTQQTILNFIGPYVTCANNAGASRTECTFANINLATQVTGILPAANGGTNVSTPTDDNTLVGDGTSWQVKALPNCVDTGGQHLNYATATNSFSCGTSGGGGGSPGGSTTQVQYNNAGSFGGSTGLTLDGTTVVTHVEKTTNVSTNITLGVHNNVTVDATGAARTIAVPVPTASGASQSYRVTKVDSSSNAVTLDPDATVTLNGSTSDKTCNVQYCGWELHSVSATDWLVDTITVGALGVSQGGTGLTAATDDQVMLGNGTIWESKAVPNCTDTGGQHLNYTASTNSFSCGTSGGASGYATIQEEGSGLTQRATVNFIGSAITCVDNSGASKTDCTVSAMTASSTDTLTNKTLDVEATGNSVTTVSKVWLPAASCQNATAALLWDTPTSSPAVAACVTGTNTQKGVADFADAANLSMQMTLMLPSDWVGNIDAMFKWFTSATTGSVVWQLATICVADGETDDPSFNTASTVTDAAKGTTLQLNDAAITNVTATGCAAGELLHIKVFRDSGHASDNLAATARLIGLELTLRRAQ